MVSNNCNAKKITLGPAIGTAAIPPCGSEWPGPEQSEGIAPITLLSNFQIATSRNFGIKLNWSIVKLALPIIREAIDFTYLPF
jgi:hypothetical protein